MSEPIKAWVFKENGKWVIAFESTLRPGYQNRVIGTYDARHKAVKAVGDSFASDVELQIITDVCPLPRQ